MFDSPKISINLKLRFYETSVCSLLMHGCETWDLNEATCKRINDVNRVMFAGSTGSTCSIPFEVRVSSIHLNLVHKIRIRRRQRLTKLRSHSPGWGQLRNVSSIKSARRSQSPRRSSHGYPPSPFTHVEDPIPVTMSQWICIGIPGDR